MKLPLWKLVLAGSFRRQIILTFVFGFLLLISGFSAYMVQGEKDYLYRVSREETNSLADSLAATSLSWVLANDLAGLQEVMYSFRGHPQLRYAMVVSPSGRVLAHSDAAKVGLFLSDEASVALFKSAPERRVMIDDASVIDIAIPIMINGRHVGWARAAQGREDANENLHHMVLNSAIFVLLATILSLLAAVLIANRLGGRIGSLVRLAKEVQAGNFTVRAAVAERADEIARLGSSFNRMLDALAHNEKELRDASLYTRSLIEASLDPLVTISLEGKITDVNEATEKATGYSRAELVGTDFSDYFTEPDKAREGYRQVFQAGFVKDYSLAIRHKDGHVIEVLYNASVYRNEQGEVQGVFAAARDVTERKAAEQEVARLALRNKLILESAGDGIYGLDNEGRCTFINPSAARLFGFSVEEFVGQPPHPLIHHTKADGSPYPQEECPVQAAFKQGQAHYGEDLYWRKDGSSFPVDFISTPIVESGVTTGAVVIFRDITERKQAEKELFQAQQIFRSLVENSPDIITRYDRDCRRTYVNPSYLKAAGMSRQELLGASPVQNSPLLPDSAAALQNLLRRVLDSGLVESIDIIWPKSDNIDHWYNIYAFPEYDREGQVVSVMTMSRDITGRKQAEDALRTSESRYRALVESAPMCIHEIGMDGRITSMNKAGLVMMGVEEECKVQGFLYLDAVCDADRQRIGDLLAKAYAGESSYFEFKASGPKEMIFKSCFVPLRDRDGIVVKLMGITEDITERKKAEKVLRQSEKALRDAQRIAHLGNWELDLVSNVLSWSDEIYRIFEIDQAKFGASYEAFLNAIHPDDREMVDKAYTDSLKNRTPYEIVHRLLMKDGRIKYVNEKCETYYGVDGKPLRSIGTVHDITERKRAEDVLQQSEEALKESQRIAHLGSWSMDLATNEIFWSEELYKMYGYDPALPPPLYTESMKLFTPESWERLSTAISRATETGIPYELELELVSKGGIKGWMLARGELVRDAQGKAVRMRGVVMDITARKQAEVELRELNNDFVTLLENTGDFIYFKDKDSRIIFCSQTMAAITGHESWRDMVGKHDMEIFPPDTARIYYEEELPIFREGRPLLNKIDPYYDSRGKLGWVSTNKWPVFGEDGTVMGIFGISRDITELKEAEDRVNELNRELEQRVIERTAQLEDANKELEAFSYSVSHDLRTPLRAIDGFSRILLEEYSSKIDDEGRHLLGVVRDNAVRMAALIDDILQFSRTGRMEINLATIDMEALARDVLDELRPALPNPKLQVEIGHLPQAPGDRAMLRQVFANLLSNAIKFSGHKEEPRIEVGGGIEGNEAVYFVKDNGAGFDMQYADKLFGVFQRLHSVSEFEGTGIGLAIVKRVVTRHGGRVWAQGRMNEGATIYFALPDKEGKHG